MFKKRFMTWAVAAALLVSGMSSGAGMAVTNASESVSNPEITRTGDIYDTCDKVVYDCVWFGSYPQAEVIASAADKSCKGDIEGDYIIDPTTVAALRKSKDWDEENTLIYNQKKYKRINAYDASCVYEKQEYDNFFEYVWDKVPGDDGESVYSEEYHYFLYQPIKWRVLKVEDGYATLLADRILDTKAYTSGSVTSNYVDSYNGYYNTSTVRNWLNGYDEADYYYCNDLLISKGYLKIDPETEEMMITGNSSDWKQASGSFINTAFSKEEQEAIAVTHIEDPDSPDIKAPQGDAVDDKIFLLSKGDIAYDQGAEYGFSADNNDWENVRMTTATMYSIALGADVSDVTVDFEIRGNCTSWWLRTSYINRTDPLSAYSAIVRYTGVAGTYSYFDPIANYVGVRPALRLKLSETSSYEYAGTLTAGTEVVMPAVEEKAPVMDHGTSIHIIKKVAAKAPTYTATGNKEYWMCIDCKTIYADAEGKTVLSLSDVTIPKLPKLKQNIKTAKIKTYRYKKLKKKKATFKLKTKAFGKVTYKVSKKTKKYIKVSKSGKVTIKKGAKKGKYKIVITAKGNYMYLGATKTVYVKVR